MQTPRGRNLELFHLSLPILSQTTSHAVDKPEAPRFDWNLLQNNFAAPARGHAWALILHLRCKSFSL
jgi:hypothetical protein